MSLGSKMSPNNQTVMSDSDHLYEFLASIQLENFVPLLRDKLQITRVAHFDFVKPKDLEKIGMSKPAIRRLLDTVSRSKQMQLPARPPPPVPSQTLATTEISKPNGPPTTTLKSVSIKPIMTLLKPESNNLQSLKPKQQLISSEVDQSVSQIISANAIQIVKTKTGEDEILGTGHFGVVKKAVWARPRTNARTTVAVKCLHSTGIDQQAFVDILNEVSAMCNLNHPNLIKLHGVVFNTTENSNGMVMMVTELASHGSLYAYLRRLKIDKKYPQISQLYSFIFQIANGMEYLESKKLIHRDLAARNILLSSPDHVKICDFGMARSVQNQETGQYKMNETHKIPCAWYAPESIRHKLFSSKSDVWSFGVTLWECFSLCEQPWPHLTAGEILAKLETESKRLSQPYLCSRSFYRVVLSCWEYNASERPTFAALKTIIKGTRIVDMRAKESFSQDGRLEVSRGDLITIVDGCASNYWWKGQNKRTLGVGKFPRMILDPERKLCGEDISLPLRNSFIHTGHMGSKTGEAKSWGNPGKIDEIFLRNPLKPPDLLDEIDEETTLSNYKSQATNENNKDVLLVDLSETISGNDLKVSYPDNLSNKSDSSSLADLVGLQIDIAPQSSNQYYVNNKYMDEKFAKSGEADLQPRTYYNELSGYFKPPNYQSQNFEFNPDARTLDDCRNRSSTVSFKPTNPFYTNQRDASPPPPPLPKVPPCVYVPSQTVNANQSKIESSINSQKTSSFDSQVNNAGLTVDDLLCKVMNDVINDLNKFKF